MVQANGDRTQIEEKDEMVQANEDRTQIEKENGTVQANEHRIEKKDGMEWYRQMKTGHK